MKFLTTIATVSVVALTTTGAFAQSAFNGNIGVTYIHAPDDEFDYQAQIHASAVFALSPALSVQADIVASKYEDDSAVSSSYTVHGIYHVNEMLDFGVFYSDQFDGGYTYGGIEVAYRNGAFDVEAHAEMEDIFDYSGYYNLGAQVGYTFGAVGSLPSVGAYVGFNTQFDDGDVYLPSIYAGVKATVWENIDLDARAASMDDGEYMYYSLGFSYNFGSGTIFTARNYVSTFPGY